MNHPDCINFTFQLFCLTALLQLPNELEFQTHPVFHVSCPQCLAKSPYLFHALGAMGSGTWIASQTKFEMKFSWKFKKMRHMSVTSTNKEFFFSFQMFRFGPLCFS